MCQVVLAIGKQSQSWTENLLQQHFLVLSREGKRDRELNFVHALREIEIISKRSTRKARSEELSMQQLRNSTTVSQMIAQIQDLQNKVNSLSDAREFYDPESGSSFGATHVPDQTSSILSSRTYRAAILDCCEIHRIARVQGKRF